MSDSTARTLQLFAGFMQVNLERGLLVAQQLLDDIRNRRLRPGRMSPTLADAFRASSLVLDAFKLDQRAEKYGTRRMLEPAVASQLDQTLIQFGEVVRELRLEGDPDVNELYTRLMQRLQHKLSPAKPPEPKPTPEPGAEPKGRIPSLPGMPSVPHVDAGYRKVSRTNGEYEAAEAQARTEPILPPVKPGKPESLVQSGPLAGKSAKELMQGISETKRIMKELSARFEFGKPPGKPPPG